MEIQPDKRLTDPAKVQASIEAKEAAYEGLAAYSKGLGILTSISVIDLGIGRRAVFNAEDGNEVAFMKWLHTHYPTGHSSELGAQSSGDLVLLGFEAKDFIKLAGFGAALSGLSVPVRAWYDNRNCFDPYEMCVDSEMRQYVSLDKLLKMLRIEAPANYRPHISASMDCKITLQMAIRAGMLPVKRLDLAWTREFLASKKAPVAPETEEAQPEAAVETTETVPEVEVEETAASVPRKKKAKA